MIFKFNGVEYDALDILKINPPFTQSELKKQYHKLCMEVHPDINPGIDDNLMKRLHAAYDCALKALKKGNDISLQKTKKQSRPHYPKPPTVSTEEPKKETTFDKIGLELEYLRFSSESGSLKEICQKLEDYMNNSNNNPKIRLGVKLYLSIFKLSSDLYERNCEIISNYVNNEIKDEKVYLQCINLIKKARQDLNDGIAYADNDFFEVLYVQLDYKNKDFIKILINNISKELKLREIIKDSLKKRWKFGTQENYNEMYKYIASALKERMKMQEISIKQIDEKTIKSIIKEEKQNFKRSK